MDQILNLAKQAAIEAGKHIRLAADKIDSLNIEQKSLHDYVSEVDRQSESIIAEIILERFPEHTLIGEEYGQQGKKNGDYQWIIDPLDGTTNFLRSIPHYAVSIAVTHNDIIEYGVVFDPAKEEMYCAQRGQGAYLNDRKIGVSQCAGLRGGLLATGVPFSGENLAQLDKFTAAMTDFLEQQTSGIRRLGSAALDLAYVAAGRYDGYWEAMLKSWDIAAGILLVEEAGGIVSELNGGSQPLHSGDILAASPMVHRDMLIISQRYY